MTLSITVVIVAITVLVSWRAFNHRALLERLILWPPALERGRQYGRLLTHGFIHADWGHLLFNMITLWSFGTAVERVFSEWITPVGYVLFYLSAIVVAILPTYLRHRHDVHYRSLGASGGVSAVLFAFILFDPWSKLVIFPIPVPIRPSCSRCCTWATASGWTAAVGTTSTTARTCGARPTACCSRCCWSRAC